MIAIKWSDYQKYGCPKCGCKSARSGNVSGRRTKYDEKSLSIRAFSESQKRRAYEHREHKCPCCTKNGIDTEYAYNEMQGDHIIPWSQGGRTVDENL